MRTPILPILVLAAMALAGCVPAAPAGTGTTSAAPVPAPAASGLDFQAPVTDAQGITSQLQARLCRPAGTEPARLVVIAHGSPPDAEDRPRMRLTPCSSEAVRWFTARGYAVAVSLRRGYGATGGTFAEDVGSCRTPRFGDAGLETARDLLAVVDAALALPGVRPDGAVLVGQSAGGLGAMAVDSVAHPKVAAIVSMAGGRGGHAQDLPNRNCRPDLLAEAAGRYGATATTPMLWIYAANDSYFAPAIAEDMHARFTAAGGRAELVQPGPFGSDGHRLFFGRGGSTVWGPVVARYLARQDVGPS